MLFLLIIWNPELKNQDADARLTGISGRESSLSQHKESSNPLWRHLPKPPPQIPVVVMADHVGAGGAGRCTSVPQHLGAEVRELLKASPGYSENLWGR